MNPHIEKMLSFNKEFVKNLEYEQYETDKYPSTGIAILTCMDTRLTALLPAALNLKNGDVKMIKNAGAYLREPFGDVLRSLLVSIYELNVNEIMVIGHTNCGVQGLRGEEMLRQMRKRGISAEVISDLKHRRPDLISWLDGFQEITGAVQETVELLRNHPLIPADIRVGGYLIDIVTGELTVIDCE